MNTKNSLKILLIIEVQVVLILLIFMIVKIEKLDKKVYNTNKFVYELLSDKKIEQLNTLKDNDIIIGEADAPVTVIVYSRFDCSACNSFFIDNYERLKTGLVEQGIVKLVVRYLVHQSKPYTLYTTKCAHFAYQNGHYDSFVKELGKIYPTMDSSSVKNIVLDLKLKQDSLNSYTDNSRIEKELILHAQQMRKAGIRYTPTIFVNKRQLIGNRNYENLEKAIIEELENNVCD